MRGLGSQGKRAPVVRVCVRARERSIERWPAAETPLGSARAGLLHGRASHASDVCKGALPSLLWPARARLAADWRGAPHGGGTLFHARASVRLPAGLSEEDFRDALEQSANALVVDIVIGEE